jgi:2-polyprenyl-6-hydroxyphenyl methylase/3-demethylubiquinone-9 3-methyltransferase
VELGCGYGRVIRELERKASYVLGIDTCRESLMLAKRLLGMNPKCGLAQMDATNLALRDGEFDLVVCVQNGIAAFAVDQERLVGEAIRVLSRGGKALFSSYSDRFWDDRLAWFDIQAEHGLIGEIDRRATHDGVIVTRDGFRAGTVSSDAFRILSLKYGITPRIVEVDGSSVFCEMAVE